MHHRPLPSEAGVPPARVVCAFVTACGLRKAALARLRVGDIRVDNEGHVWVNVTDHDGIPIYEVPVLEGHEHVVLSVVEGHDPEELVFAQLPHPLRVQACRIAYARSLYEEVCADNTCGYDEDGIVTYVMDALGEPGRPPLLPGVAPISLGTCAWRRARKACASYQRKENEGGQTTRSQIRRHPAARQPDGHR